MDLKNSVIELLKHNISLVGVPRSVGIQLSVVLADLALQVLEWKDVVKEMVETFGGNSQSLPCLLEFLKVLPEELLNPRHSLLSDEEFSLRSEELLDRNANHVVKLLLEYGKGVTDGGSNSSRSGTVTPGESGVGGGASGGTGIRLSANNLSVLYECLNSWLKEISIEDFLNTSLFDLLFCGLNNYDSFESAVECICSTIKETRDAANLNIISLLYPRVVALRGKIVEAKDDSNELIGLTKVFSEAGESWHMLIAQSPNDFLELIECIVDCISVDEDLDAISYTFYFWYSLKQMIVMDKYVESRHVLSSVYLRLIGIFIERLKYPSGDENSDLFNGNREDEEKFRSFRHEIGDVLKDCCAVVGSSEALNESYKVLNNSLTVANGSSSTWQSIEAPLFSVRAMGQVVDLNENTVLPNIMSQLLSLPENNKIRYTATLVLGRYTEWTAKHPEYLDFQLDYIIKGFDNNDNNVSKAAAQALMYFCQDCRDLLAKYIEQLHPFYEKMLSVLDIESLYQVTEGIAHIIRAQPIESILLVLQHFSKPIVARLIDLTKSEGSDEVYRSIADIIELLTIFVRHIRPNTTTNGQLPAGTVHPTTQFIFEVFPIVPPLIQAHGTSSFVAERSSKFIKYCLHTSGSGLEPILSTIGNILANEFERTKFGCYLWVSGALISVFNTPEDYTPLIDQEKTKQFVWEFCKHQSYSFFRILSDTTDPKDLPDLIEDYFHFASDILMYYPYESITSDWLNTTFQAALASLTLEQFDPLIATLHFLLDLFGYGQEKAPSSSVIPGGVVPAEIRNAVTTLATSQGEILTKAVITGILFFFPKDVITDASSLLLSVYRLSNGPQSIQWLSNALNSLPPGGLSEDEKTKFLQRISVSVESQDFKRVRSILRDFTTLYTRRNLTPRVGPTTSARGTTSSGFSFAG